MLVRQIATKLSVKRGERYSDTVGFVRRRIRFDLIRTCVSVKALRGHNKTTAPDSIRDLDFILNLRGLKMCDYLMAQDTSQRKIILL